MNILKKYLSRILASPVLIQRNIEKTLIGQCLTQARANRQREHIRTLADVEFRGFSQWGEDGILDWLVERLPGIPETFVEFGVENYRESNTRLLLWLRNWRGLVIDGSPSNILDIHKQEVSWRFDLIAICAFIDRDNINDLISLGEFGEEIGILSIDIDGNDYWVWENISVVSPIIIVCEYNAVFGDLRRITIPYQPDFQRERVHYSNLYFGASLQALISLGNAKGYTFVGTNSNGCNAFFIRNDRVPEILGSLEGISSCGSRFRESRDTTGSLTFIRGKDRVGVICDNPVFDLDLKQEISLGELGELYSETWQKQYC
jgi:hypothetical protein